MEYLEALSNREKALFVWVLITLVGVLLFGKVRKSLIGVINAFFVKQILLLLTCFLAYVSLIIALLHGINFWEVSLLKDTFFWVIGALVLIYKVDKVKDKNYLTTIMKDAVKWTIVIEFIIAFYTFSFSTELILIPILVFTGIMQTVASADSKYKLVESLVKKIMNFIGFVILFYVCFKTYNQYKDILTIGQIKSFLLPPIFTFLFLPFIYGLAIFMKYETIFSRLPFIVKEKKLRALVRNQIIRTAQLNIDKLTAISSNISRIEIVDKTNLSDKIEGLCKTSLLSIK